VRNTAATGACGGERCSDSGRRGHARAVSLAPGQGARCGPALRLPAPRPAVLSARRGDRRGPGGRGTRRGSAIWGSAIWGSAIWGSAIWGSATRGGSIRSGAIRSGTIRGWAGSGGRMAASAGRGGRRGLGGRAAGPATGPAGYRSGPGPRPGPGPAPGLRSASQDPAHRGIAARGAGRGADSRGGFRPTFARAGPARRARDRATGRPGLARSSGALAVYRYRGRLERRPLGGSETAVTWARRPAYWSDPALALRRRRLGRPGVAGWAPGRHFCTNDLATPLPSRLASGYWGG
jgi:hypothetical protein